MASFSDLVKINGKKPVKKKLGKTAFRMDGELVALKKGKNWYRREQN